MPDCLQTALEKEKKAIVYSDVETEIDERGRIKRTAKKVAQKNIVESELCLKYFLFLSLYRLFVGIDTEMNGGLGKGILQIYVPLNVYVLISR
jgi:hypothetical protein